MTARGRMAVPESDHSIEEAAAHLYAAVLQILPTDDQIVADHVREALRLLDPDAHGRATRIRATIDLEMAEGGRS